MVPITRIAGHADLPLLSAHADPWLYCLRAGSPARRCMHATPGPDNHNKDGPPVHRNGSTTMKRFTTTLLSSALAGLFVTAGAMAQETLKIGWIGPLSGWGTFGGTAIMRGTALAIDHINAKGGVN